MIQIALLAAWLLSCSFLIQFNSYSKMIQIALLAAWLLQCSLLIQFLFKIDTIKLEVNYARPAMSLLLWSFLIQFLFKIDANSYLWLPSSSCGHFTLNSYSELMQIHLLDALPPPVVISYSIRKIISWTQIAAFTFNPNHDSRP